MSCGCSNSCNTATSNLEIQALQNQVSTLQASLLLFVSSNSLIRGTQAQILALTPQSGRFAFSTDTQQFLGYNGTAWVILG